MSRISLLLFLGAAAVGVLEAQPTITSLQSGFSASLPQFGAAITSGTPIYGFALFLNGTFSPGNLTKVEWTNTATGFVYDFTPSFGIAVINPTLVVVNVPVSVTEGSFFGTIVNSPQTINITAFQGSSVSNTAIFTVNPPVTVPASLPAETIGQPDPDPIFSGGTGPYEVTLAEDSNPGSLPPGLNFTSSTTLSGTPTQSGVYTFDVAIYDEWGNYCTATETIEIVGVPNINSVVVNSASAGSNPVPITVSGTNFVAPTTGLPVNYAGTVIEIAQPGGPVQLPTTVLNGITATATIPANYLTTPQQLNILVQQPSPAASTSVPFTVIAPSISTVSPLSLTARSTPVALTVTGGAYLAAGSAAPAHSTILVSGNPVTTAFGSTSSLSASVIFSTPGSIPVRVENPAGSLSNTVSITVLPDPVITSVTPNPFPGGALAVNGSNFTATMTVLFNGTPIPTGFVNAGQLTGTVPASLYTGTSALVSVVTSDAYTTPSVRIALDTPPQITTASIPPATGLQSYDAKLTATGGVPPYFWSAAGLPQGLTINSATGEITGTPSTFGGFNISVTVTDSLGLSGNTHFQTAVSTPAPAPQVAPATLPNGFVNVSYNFAFTATGGNGSLQFGLSSGTLPPGLNLDNTGVLKGLPTTVGSYTFSVSVTDIDQLSSNTAFTLVIKPQPLAITTPGPLASVTVGSAVSGKFAAFGGVPPYTFSSTGNLPPGTSVAADGTFSGTTTAAGTFSFTVVVNDSAQDTPGTKTFSITINPLPLAVTASLGSGQVAVAYSGTIGATGGIPPYTFNVTGLPDGLSFASGTVSGTPTTPGQFTVSVTVTDSAKTPATGSFPVTINAPALTITTTSLPAGTVNVAYSASLGASGGTGKFSWVVTGLPAGLTATSAGAISGTPTAPGTFSVSATVTDTGIVTAVISASKTFSVTIAPPPLTVSTASLANATAGAAYTASVTASGGISPYTFVATGLPSGLTMSSAGAISGTTTAVGAASVGVTVKDSAGTSASRTLTLTVALPPTPALTVTGLPATSAPATQSTVGVSIGTAFPVAVTVNLTLTFAPVSGPDDPTVQFATGGRTATLTIPAGSTAASTTVGVQTGTVAGTATVTIRMLAGTQDITPTPAPTNTVKINSVAPVITSLTATANSGGFTVTAIGFATSRAMTQAVFTFTPASGVNLQTTTVTIPAATLFTTWYSSSAALPFGGQFSFVQPFTVSGATSAVASVSVTLTNGDGTSNVVTATVH